MRVLVSGATGYIGGRLAPRLAAAGYPVRCLTRSTGRLARVPWAAGVEVVQADVLRPATLPAAFDAVDIAYYLVHSLGGRDFETVDRRGAEHFAAAAHRAGVRRIVYLGGPAPRAQKESAHLRSREEVARILLGSGVPTVVLRAAVILGSGSASFEMLRYLTEHLPVMVTPRWVRNRVQPIAIGDVLHYLTAAAGLPPAVHRDFDIGGPDVLTFEEMMRRYAVIAGLPRRIILPVRPLTPQLSAHWVGLVTPVPSGIAKPLVASLVHEAVCRDRAVAEHIPDPPGGLTGFDDAVRLALARLAAGQPPPAREVSSPAAAVPPVAAWPAGAGPADPLPTDPAWAGGICYTDVRTLDVAAPAERLWQVVERAGGTRGWRVAELDRGRLLRLRATARLPGRAWLGLRVSGDGRRSRYEQRMLFVPRGLTGHLAWLGLAPLRGLVLGGLARRIARAAQRRGGARRWSGAAGPDGPGRPGRTALLTPARQWVCSR